MILKGNFMFRIILCDDNEQFLKIMKNCVEEECRRVLSETENFEIGAIFCNGRDVLEYVTKYQVDVIFLDIDMPDFNGFEVAKVLCDRYKSIKIVFVSAYDNFVYNSFEFCPFAYLRKSHISDELPKVFDRIAEKTNSFNTSLLLNTTNGTKNVYVSSIMFAESERNYYKLHLLNGETLICRGTISELEKTLVKKDFFRIHSAFLINLEHVERLIENNSVLISETRIPIAQRRMQDFKKAYMEYLRRCFGT